jgi:hypothetical protein
LDSIELRNLVDGCSLLLGRGRGIFSVFTTVGLQKVLGRTFVMVQLCHSNDFGSLQLCSSFAIWMLALLLPISL